jgi:flavin reductase (DIM6/NTAB) family NADH-FMN oxidoreductase RutF
VTATVDTIDAAGYRLGNIRFLMRNGVAVPVDATLFRSVLALWPSGVGVVTTLAPASDGGPPRPHGMTASSFSSVSLDPPLVSVCLGNHLATRRLVASAGAFAVSFLGKDQAAIGQRFAGPGAGDRFAGSRWETAETGCPVLADATGWLDCRIAQAHPAGDHTIFVGLVVAAATPRVTAPLLFHSRSWGQLADPLPEEISLTLPHGGAAVSYPTEVPLARRAGARRVEVTAADTGDLDRVVAVRVAADAAGLPTVAYVADAFAPDRERTVLTTLDALADAACAGLGVAEASAASPLQVRRVLQDAVVRVRPAPLRVRLRAHHGLGLVNALVAMKSGARHFDTVLDPGCGGLPARDLHLLARQLGVACPAPSTRE